MSLRIAAVLALSIIADLPCHADFSYLLTERITGGIVPMLDRESRLYVRGQKMAIDENGTTTVIDFGARTVTVIDPASKSYSVRTLPDPVAPNGAGFAATGEQADVRSMQPGIWKDVNGLRATEVTWSILAHADLPGGMALRLRYEFDGWVAMVAGSEELHAFFKDHAVDFPFDLLMHGTSPGLRNGMARLRDLSSGSAGVAVHQVVRVSVPSDSQLELTGQMDAAKAAQLQKEFRNLQSEIRLHPSQSILLESTGDASEFSDAPVPDYIFAVPNGYVLRK